MKLLSSKSARKGVAIAAVVTVGMGVMSNVAFAATPAVQAAKVVRIGYLTNLTHAPALVARDAKLFEKYLSAHGTTIQYVTFNAGPDEINALKGNAIDLAFVGPSLSINGYVTTNGSLLKIISGTTSGGAELVVAPSITSAAQLKGTKLASPQLGNTQDVALRSWLASQGLKTSLTGKGDVTVVPTSNSLVLALYKSHQLQGGWLPEPWSSQLVIQGGAEVLVNEKSLWANGQFETTDLVSSTDFLNKYPDTVLDILKGELDAINLISTNVTAAQAAVQKQLLQSTGKALDAAVLARAWRDLSFTVDPLTSSLRHGAVNAVKVGLLPNFPANGLARIYDLRLLNQILKARKLPTVSAGGLGVQ